MVARWNGMLKSLLPSIPETTLSVRGYWKLRGKSLVRFHPTQKPEQGPWRRHPVQPLYKAQRHKVEKWTNIRVGFVS